jgi:cbb3-type cytochrome oxidase subunit 3
MSESRLEIYPPLVISVVFAMTFKIFNFLIPIKKLRVFLKFSSISIIVVLILFYQNFTFDVPKGNKYEYDEAANSYLKIKDHYPISDWTIISTTEQYEECLGYGWHYNLWLFDKIISEKKEKKLEFTTDYIFFFTEKYPLGSNIPISEADAKSDFPQISGQLVEYYRNEESRKILEAKMYYWAEDYMKRNKNMKVFFENKNMKIYMLKQDGKNPINLLGNG